MSDYVCAGWLAENDLNLLLSSPPTPFKWMILEAVDEVKFGPLSNEINLGRYKSGRVFSPACEIRWQYESNLFHTVLTGNITQPPAPLTSETRELLAGDFDHQDGSYFLWGEWSDNDPRWLEASIPHIFDYPVPQGKGKWRI